MYTILLSRVLLASLLSQISLTLAADPVPNIIPGETNDHGKIARFKNIIENEVQQPTADIILDGDAAWRELFKGGQKWGNLTNGFGGGEPLNVVCSQECRACAQGCNPACCLVGGSVITVRPRPEDESGRRGNRPSGSPSRPSRPVKPLPPGIPRPLPNPDATCPCHCENTCPAWIQAICCFTPDFADPEDSASMEAEADKLEFQRVAAAVEPDNDSQTPLVPAPPRPLIPRLPWVPEACPCTCEASCPAHVQAICCLTGGSLSRNRPSEDNLVPPEKEDDHTTVPPPSPVNPHTIPLIVQTSPTSPSPDSPVTILSLANLTIFPSYITMDIVVGLSRTSEIKPNVAGDGAEIALTVLVGPDGQEKAYEQSFVVVDGSNLAEKEGVVVGVGFLSRVGALELASGWGGKEEIVGVPLLTGTKVEEEGEGKGGKGEFTNKRVRDEL
ncbi:hypothetical protein PV10_06493 [Exophiala mesophila]|uniref:Uncharacterized protein n=1 Tax=Exophiala mesophila TaxID=212818 RepID=A0A0D1ZYW3_EXOME|nr:uncharacterized protein PV10_06493 [Exophiala mesophila]KIV92013.1 hypothetical protein PV10_06493 [Exophiala mesophila]